MGYILQGIFPGDHVRYWHGCLFSGTDRGASRFSSWDAAVERGKNIEAQFPGVKVAALEVMA